MREVKRKRLEATGWKVGEVDDFLDLTAQELEYINLRLRLAEGLRARRRKQRLTQVDLAKRIGSSQSRVAKMESGDPSVTIDLLIRALFAIGGSREDLAQWIASRKEPQEEQRKRET
ncbi:MAG: helix-turn-helix domain-containing protein [Deltaproteobacteria bacterium]|nr:helix-turn-helix domain-containing protein [Deltaproteobacteria bacterium]